MILFIYVCFHVFCFSLVVWFSCWRGVNDVTINMFSLKIGIIKSSYWFIYHQQYREYFSYFLHFFNLICWRIPCCFQMMVSNLSFQPCFLETIWIQFGNSPRLICCKSPKKRVCSWWNNPNSPDRHRSRFFLSASLRGVDFFSRAN